MATAAPSGNVAALVFRRDGAELQTLTLADMVSKVQPTTVKAFDPLYHREKSYRAVPLGRVLEIGFAGVDLAKQEYVLHAQDGYTVPMRGALAMEEGAYLAFEDAEVPGWEPIGEQRKNPGPFYLIWSKREQTELVAHPRPYQLVSIDIARFEDVFPRTVPVGIAKGEPAERGFQIFREQCLACHAINRQGGRVGPDLNVPQSIVEYRPVDQIRAYIRQPQAFRYTEMPPHPGLADGDLDDLIAYFKAMKERKQDVDASPLPAPSSGASTGTPPQKTPSAAPARRSSGDLLDPF